MAKERRMKTAFVAELVPSDRKLVELAIELSNAPGSTAAIASILSKHDVNILSGFHDPGHWSFFADVTKCESSFEDVVKEISSLAVVNKVSSGNVVSEGIIVDTLHQQMMWGPFRTIIIRAEVMSSIFDRVKTIFGPEGKAGKAMVHGMGEAAGRNFYKGLASHMSAEIIKSHIEDIIQLHGADGWGDFRLAGVDFDRMTASVAVVNDFECAHLERAGYPSPNFTCDFVRGHLAGLFSEVFGKRVTATETLCVAHGHAKCQFEIDSYTTPR